MNPYPYVLLTVATVALLVAYHSLILRQRIDRLTRDLATARWRYTHERQRANVYRMSINRHLAAKGVLLREVRLLERKYVHLCVRRAVQGYRPLRECASLPHEESEAASG